MTQKPGDITKLKILEAGIKLWPDVSVSAVAAEAGLTHPAVLYHFPEGKLKEAIARHGVETKNSRVIVQLIAQNHPFVAGLSKADKLLHFDKM